MSVEEVTAYIDAQPEPKRSTLLATRDLIMQIEPNLEQVIAWKSPQFKLNGKYVLGLCAFKNHLTCSPQSSAVMDALASGLEGFVTSGSSFQFAIDKPLPKALLGKMIALRLAELG